jgi:hypothetical protein
MTDNDFRDQILTHMATTNERLETVFRRIDKMDNKLDIMSTSGCALGKENQRRIDRIDTEPRRAMTGGAVAGGGLAAIVYVVIETVRELLP